MAYDLSSRLVIGLASSALFDLEESDYIFRTKGEEDYRSYQRQHQNNHLDKGIAFPFIKKLLSINAIRPNDPPIEVILLSRNDPDTGLRVMNSIEHHGLDITRAIFLQGKYPYPYINALSIDLFLSGNDQDVKLASQEGYPAGLVLPSKLLNESSQDEELRIALDFDGVIADDEAEKVFASEGLEAFHDHEKEHADRVHHPGPLAHFLKKLSHIQQLEMHHAKDTATYTPKLRLSIVTARNAPSHKRVINTLRQWGIIVNEAFFLGGVDKSKVLEVLNPHIFFDDQEIHLKNTVNISPSVHIPFGIKNSF